MLFLVAHLGVLQVVTTGASQTDTYGWQSGRERLLFARGAGGPVDTSRLKQHE
jgi:hypothetical protein